MRVCVCVCPSRTGAGDCDSWKLSIIAVVVGSCGAPIKDGSHRGWSGPRVTRVAKGGGCKAWGLGRGGKG